AQSVLEDQLGRSDVALPRQTQQRVDDAVHLLCGEPIEQALAEGGDLSGVRVAGSALVALGESSLAVAVTVGLGNARRVDAAHALDSVRFSGRDRFHYPATRTNKRETYRCPPGAARDISPASR